MLGGFAIGVLSGFQIWRVVFDTTIGAFAPSSDLFSLYFLNGITGGVGLCAFAISVKTAYKAVGGLRANYAQKSGSTKIGVA